MAGRNRRFALKSLKRKDTIGILLLGDVMVGKTSLISCWLDEDFSESYIPTVEEFKVKPYGTSAINVGLVDLAGSGQFSAMEELYILKSEGIMFVYEIGNEKSLASIERYCKKVRKLIGDRRITCAIVGTKLDKNKTVSNNDVTIPCFLESKEPPRQFFTSAKENVGVKEAFEYMAEEITFDFLPSEARVRALTNDFEKREKKKNFCCYNIFSKIRKTKE